MRQAWKKSGRIAFWISLPLLHIYLRSQRRTRVLVVSEGMVLLTKAWLSNGKWMLPGGGLHFREEPAHGAVREVREETGIILLPSQLQPIGEARFRRYGLRFRYEQFIVELPKTVELKPQRTEIVEATWVPIESINAKTAETDVLRLLQAWKGLQRVH